MTHKKSKESNFTCLNSAWDGNSPNFWHSRRRSRWWFSFESGQYKECRVNPSCLMSKREVVKLIACLCHNGLCVMENSPWLSQLHRKKAKQLISTAWTSLIQVILKNEILGVSNLQQSLKVNHFTAYSRTKISPDDCAEGILRVEEGRQEEGAGEGEGEREWERERGRKKVERRKGINLGKMRMCLGCYSEN